MREKRLVKRGAVRANDLPLSNDLDSSVGRALDVQSQGSRVLIPLGSVIFSNFHFSELLVLQFDYWRSKHKELLELSLVLGSL